jgi:hypothetical protein
VQERAGGEDRGVGTIEGVANASVLVCELPASTSPSYESKSSSEKRGADAIASAGAVEAEGILCRRWCTYVHLHSLLLSLSYSGTGRKTVMCGPARRKKWHMT